MFKRQEINNEMIMERLERIERSIERLIEMWEPTEKKEPEAEIAAEAETGLTLINFSKKYDFNINTVKARCKYLRHQGKLSGENCVLSHNGRRPVYLLTAEGEQILLDYMKYVENKPRKPRKKMVDMTKEELLKELYRKNHQLNQRKRR